ncbi:MAG: hypothetical protein BYD32DRAFT_467571 [Podila humilis]|nr:MAG: hypothetical protein BYD32DRAFT_467571 [Podila humilis]
MAGASTPNEDATKITSTTSKPSKSQTKTKTINKTKSKATTTKGSKSKAPYRKEDYEVIHGWLTSKINSDLFLVILDKHPLAASDHLKRHGTSWLIFAFEARTVCVLMAKL